MVHPWDMGLTYILDFLQLPYFDIATVILNIFYAHLCKLWLLCNLITWQNSDAGRMAVPAWNMLSAFFYSPHVGLTSYLCELDINPYVLAITAERLENKYKTNNNMLRSI